VVGNSESQARKGRAAIQRAERKGVIAVAQKPAGKPKAPRKGNTPKKEKGKKKK